MESLILGNDDPRIIYGPPHARWSSASIQDVDGGTVTVKTPVGTAEAPRVLLQFRGTGIKVYGGGSGIITLSVDEQRPEAVNAPPPFPGSGPLFAISGLEDIDHQLHITCNGYMWVDHFELESSSGEGFDLINHGTNATSVPTKAITVEDDSEEIVRSGRWRYSKNNIYSNQSLLATNFTATSLTYTFEGVAIWYFADFDVGHAARRIYLDDGPTEIVSTKTVFGQIVQGLVWFRTGLDPTIEHTLTIEHAGSPGEFMTLDFLRVLRSEDANALSITQQPSAIPITPSVAITLTPSVAIPPPSTSAPTEATTISPANAKVVAIGVTLGVITLIVTLMSMLWFLRRKRKLASREEVSFAAPQRSYISPSGPPPLKLVTSFPDSYKPERPQSDILTSQQLSSSGIDTPTSQVGPEQLLHKETSWGENFNCSSIVSVVNSQKLGSISGD